MSKVGRGGGAQPPRPGGGARPSGNSTGGSRPTGPKPAQGPAQGPSRPNGARTTSLAGNTGPSRSRTAPLNAADLNQLKGSGIPATIGLNGPEKAGTAQKAPKNANAPKTKLGQAFADDPAFRDDLKAMKGQWNSKTKNGEKLGKVLVNLLEKQPNLPGMASGKDLVKSIVSDLAHPMRISQGQGTTTCTTASLQIILARSKPAEYARIAGELATQGQATLRDGSKIRTTSKDVENLAGREPLHAALQEGMYRLGESLGKGGTRTNPVGGSVLGASAGNFAGRFLASAVRSFAGTLRTAAKTAFAGTGFTATRRTFAGEGGAGLNIDQFNELSRKVTGSKKVAMQPNQQVLMQLRQSGDDVTVFLRPEKGAKSGHAVVITGWDGDKAIIDDPEKSEKVKMSMTELYKRAEFVQSDASTVSGSRTTLGNVLTTRAYWPSSLGS